MSTFVALPLQVRLVIVLGGGALIGAVVNYLVYCLEREGLPLSPWLRDHPRDDEESWLDRVPILGWWFLQRKGYRLGFGFWVRPLLVEVAAVLLIGGLYWWETIEFGLIDPLWRKEAIWSGWEARILLGPQPTAEMIEIFHWQWLNHVVLVSFMLLASLVDWDEHVIPDEITVPGTLLALIIAALAPWSVMTDAVVQFGQQLAPLHATSPERWPDSLAAAPNIQSLLLGLAAIWAWCLALLPRTWYSRHGVRRAFELWAARVVRSRATYLMLGLTFLASLGIAATWYRGGFYWQSLLSALLGMVGGGALVWGVRLVAGVVMRREAMGFGDVTLLAMIGAALGWQATPLVFFLAPLAALVIGLVQWLVRRDGVLAFGPYLCIAALVVIVRWGSLWAWLSQVYARGWLVPLVLGVCLVLMGMLLALMRELRLWFERRRQA